MIQLERIRTNANAALWNVDAGAFPWWKAAPLTLVRLLYAVARDFGEGQLSLRAMSLVYTTLLSLVPLLAISFSVLKGFGVHNQIEPLLIEVLTPLGDKGAEIASRVIEFVDNVKVGVLGTLGLILLVYTVISLMQKIERAFNYCWQVGQDRSFLKRFSHYLSAIVVGPILIFTSLGIKATVLGSSAAGTLFAIEPVGAGLRLAGQVVPYLLIIVAFTFLYMFVPNTRVRLGSALVGATVAGVLWQTVGWVFASYVVSSAKYSAIYSAFATLVSWNKPNTALVDYTSLEPDPELRPGRFMYDLAKWQSEFRIMAVVPNISKSVGRFRSTGQYAGLPDRLEAKTAATDPLSREAPTRTSSTRPATSTASGPRAA